MKEIIEKISHYNLFNYLLPGVLFAVSIEHLTNYVLIQDDIIIGLFVCYFIGLVISRVGSLVVEKVLKNARFIEFKDHKEYVEASQKDSKLDDLSEQNNVYRTIIAMLLLVALTVGYEELANQFQLFNEWKTWIVLIMLFVMFLGAYRKQTKYITVRIEKNLSSNNEPSK